MTSEEAFEIVLRALQHNDRFRVIMKMFDYENFGNFIIKFREKENIKTFTCDRSQIIVDEVGESCDIPRLAIPSLYELSETKLLEGLGLS